MSDQPKRIYDPYEDYDVPAAVFGKLPPGLNGAKGQHLRISQLVDRNQTTNEEEE